jgi:hypothetical protein
MCGLDERTLGEIVGSPSRRVSLSGPGNRSLPQAHFAWRPELARESARAERRAEQWALDGNVSAHQMKELIAHVRATVRATTSRLEREVPSFGGAVPLLSRVGEVVENYAFGSDWRLLDRMLSVVKDEFLPVAEALARSGETKWWDSPVELGAQRLTAEEERSAEGRITPPVFQDSVTGSPEHGVWWSIPDRPTTTRGDLQGLPSVTLACREGHISYEERWSVWSIEVPEEARVYEVSNLDDWVRLVERHKALASSESRREWATSTRYSGTWAMPDWAGVMNSWDGVHISLLGYLSAAYRKADVDGSAVYLAGWNPDETAWLSKVRIGELVGSFAGPEA